MVKWVAHVERGGLPGFVKTFKEASNIFQFAPCFCIASLSEGQFLREAFWSDNYSVSRGNLSPPPEGSDETTSFGFNPNVVIPVQLQLLDLFQMRIWISTFD